MNNLSTVESHQFSGGQPQCVNVAKVIALKLKLIVLDEPVRVRDNGVLPDVLILLNIVLILI
ncbi:ATP-binding cassette domain-containing protein [Paenibacillus peoriae]|uniref:ATP-binding cassette domain-containing protein n=1 Tax=Paenibacillus TaxID=44249 RepID=UPI0011B03596